MTVLKGEGVSLCPVWDHPLFPHLISSAHLVVRPLNLQTQQKMRNFFLLIPFLPFSLVELSCSKDRCVIGLVQSKWQECASRIVELEEREGRGPVQICSVNLSCNTKSSPQSSQSELCHIILLCNNITNSCCFSLQNDHDIKKKKSIFLTVSQNLIFFM